MFVVFVIVAAAVLTVTWSHWEKVPAGILRICGMLSIALGVRAVALLTALFLVPLFPSFAWSDETAPAVPAVEADPSADPAEASATKQEGEEPAANNPQEPTASDVKEPSAAEPKLDPTEKATDTKNPEPAAKGSTDNAGEPVSEKAPAPEAAPALPASAENPTDPLQLQPTAEARPDPEIVPTLDRGQPSLTKPKSDVGPPPQLKFEPNFAEGKSEEAKPTAELPAGELGQEKSKSPKHWVGPPLELELQPEFSKGEEDRVAITREPVKFITNINYLTPNRPSWLEQPPTYGEKDADTLHVTVKAGPYRSVRDCEPDLEKEVSIAVANFVNEHLKARYASTFITYSLDDLRRRNVVREQFSEQLGTSLGLMNQVHAQLVFDNSFRNEIEHRWSEITSKSRLAQTGLGAGVVLLMLSTLFSYFKVDTATKGYYTGRLQFATAGAILALVAASVLLAKCIPWM